MAFEVTSEKTGHVAVFQNKPTAEDIESFEATIKELTPPTIEQKAGSIIRPSALPSLLPKKEDVPELLGGLGGMAMKKTLPGMALSGGLSAGGEAIKQIGQRAGIFEGTPPATATEAATEIGKAGLRGAGMEGFGRTVSKLFAPFAKSFTSKIQEGVALAQREGITLPLKTMTESPVVQVAERFAETSPNYFARKAVSISQNAIREFGNYANRVANAIGVSRPAEVQGNFIKETVKGYFENFIETKNKMYNSVFPQVKDLPVTASNTISTLQEIIERESVPEIGRGEFFEKLLSLLEPNRFVSELGGGAVVARRSVAKPISGGTTEALIAQTGLQTELLQEVVGAVNKIGRLTVPKGVPSLLTEPETALVNKFSTLKMMQEIINKRIRFDDPAIRGLNAELQNVSLAISQDLDEVVKSFSPDLFGQLQKANEFFGNGIELMKTKIFKGLKAASAGNEHKIVIVPNAPENVKIGREILGDDSFRDLARQWFDSVLEKSKITQEGETFISPKMLAKNLQKFGSTVDEIFIENPQMYKYVKELQQVGTLMSRGERIASGSQTAYIQPILQMGALPIITFFFNPQVAKMQLAAIASTFTAMSAVGAGVTSKFGREYLTRGFPRVGQAVGRTAQVLGQRVVQEGTTR